jgi:hypothetical protein
VTALLRQSWWLAIPAVITALLGGLRLAGVIRLSWWWVTAPLWIAAIILTGVLVLVLVALGSWGR